jgi:PAS domain S-box-containing protein
MRNAARYDLRLFVTCLSFIVLTLSCAALAGWWLHVPVLTSMIPNYATMKPSTALCLGLLGLAAFGQREAEPPGGDRRVVIGRDLAAAVALLVSGASLAEYLAKVTFGFDQWLAKVPMDRFADPAGRMSRGTCVCLILTSAALLLLDRFPRISTSFIFAGLTASVSGLVGFCFQSGPLIHVLWFRSLAVHTGLCLFLLQVAVLAARPEREPFCTLVQYQRREGKRRYLLFAVLILPLVLGLLILAGMQAQLYDVRYALAALVVLLMAIQTFILWADSFALNRVESQLRENELESSRILQSIGEAVIVTDTEARVLRMNPQAEALTGWPFAEAQGQSLNEVFAIFSEESGKPVENPVDRVKHTGKVVGLANHTVLRHRDGPMIHIDDSSAPISNEDGLLTGIVLVFRNVNERKQAEARLLASDNKLRAALAAARLGAWELDLATEEMDCSEVCKANFGRGPQDPFSYSDLLDAVDPEDRPEVTEALRLAVEKQQVYQAEYRIRWPDGSPHWIVASGQVLPGPIDTPPRIVGVTLDVTERHQSAAALIQNEKLAAVGRLASSIAHEINNPLESVTNLLFLVRSSAESPEVQQYVATAERELQRISAITSQTLRFHKQSTNPRAIICEDLIDDILSIYQGKIVNSHVCVERRKRVTRPVMCFDGEIRQVLSNLVGNAIDAMQTTGGRLLLRTREATHWRTGQQGLVMTVADTGGGISAQASARIFEPFYTTKGMAGTGLGLWISKEIVARHEGVLRVRSSQAARACGTVFTIFLPLNAAVR